MTNLIAFGTSAEARKYFKHKSYETFQFVLEYYKLDDKSLEKMDLDELKESKIRIRELFLNQEFLQTHQLHFDRDIHYTVREDDSVVGFKFTIFHQLKKPHDYIMKRITELEQTQSVKSIEKLVEEINDSDLKERFEDQINELKEANKRLEDELSSIGEKKVLFAEEIEFSKHRTEMMEKKYNIFLKFLDKESVASIVGAILLLLMGISLIIMMFYKINPIQIVQSAFLLILGYFFGHSKNNK
ncbi:hypothetical protein [Chryseobacterium cucumeris]|uniref:hypothetical protein n=1 Tax=Chryseobacterium cucumeris TaxID=1813611 RepID=UPI00192DF8C5|nr:hypothetical protein [Chryseobacterium cucumeris]QRA44309.1 hypothetical protein JNG87_06025 [Chryseobacterium cucumeris]